MSSKKEEIIQAGMYLFARHGYTETSIDKITRHANVSKGLTYTHFKSKEGLLRAVIEHSITRLTAEMMDIKEVSIQKLFANYFRSLRKNKDIVRLCLLLVAHPDTPAMVNQLLENQKQELLDLLTQLLSQKFGDKSHQEALLLLATMDGLALDYVVNPHEENLTSMENYLLDKYT
jgi:AcrR family transcriptional regulator